MNEKPEIVTVPITDGPVTMREVGIHLSHMNESIKEVKQNQVRRDDTESIRFEEIQKRFDHMEDGFVTRPEFSKHMEKDEDHEARIRILETNSTKIFSMLKTWGAAGGVLLGGMQIIEIVYLLTHLK